MTRRADPRTTQRVAGLEERHVTAPARVPVAATASSAVIAALALLLIVLVASSPPASATHKLGEDVPPGLSPSGFNTLVGRLGHNATTSPNGGYAPQVGPTLGPGTYVVVVKGRCAGTFSSPSELGITLNGQGSPADYTGYIHLFHRPTNASYWAVTYNSAGSPGPASGSKYSAWGINTDAVSGSTWNATIWFSVKPGATLSNFFVATNSFSCTVSYNEFQQSYPGSGSCAATPGSVGASYIQTSFNNACVLDATAAGPAYAAPGAPLNVTATPGNASIFVSWSRPNTGAAATSYVVCRDTTTHAATTNPAPCAEYSFATNVGNVTGYVDTDVTNGQAYFYRVRSVDNATLEGGTSAEVNATPFRAPTLTGKGFREEARLSWDTGGWTSPISFGLYRGNSTANLSLYQTLPGTARTYTDSMAPGQAFYYAVRVANATNTSPYSNLVLVAYTPPPPPLYGGDNAAIYGPDGKAALAGQMKISPTALGIFYGLFYLLGLTALGYAVGKGSGVMAAVGAGAGLSVSIVLGFFPPWLVALVAVAGAAVFFLLRRARGGGN